MNDLLYNIVGFVAGLGLTILVIVFVLTPVCQLGGDSCGCTWQDEAGEVHTSHENYIGPYCLPFLLIILGASLIVYWRYCK